MNDVFYLAIIVLFSLYHLISLAIIVYLGKQYLDKQSTETTQYTREMIAPPTFTTDTFDTNPNEAALNDFQPDFNKPIKLVYTQDEHNSMIEEEESNA